MSIVIRPIEPSDSISAITALLHRAYAKQVTMGLKPLAGRQDDGVTVRRIASGECFVAADEHNNPRGVIILNEQEPDQGPDWFVRPGHASFSQLAVDPDCQGLGIGARLLGKVESRAAELGDVELSLSMAEPDRELRDYYLRRGYRIVTTWKWPYTNYTSLILSKSLVSMSVGVSAGQ